MGVIINFLSDKRKAQTVFYCLILFATTIFFLISFTWYIRKGEVQPISAIVLYFFSITVSLSGLMIISFRTKKEANQNILSPKDDLYSVIAINLAFIIWLTASLVTKPIIFNSVNHLFQSKTEQLSNKQYAYFKKFKTNLLINDSLRKQKLDSLLDREPRLGKIKISVDSIRVIDSLLISGNDYSEIKSSAKQYADSMFSNALQKVQNLNHRISFVQYLLSLFNNFAFLFAIAYINLNKRPKWLERLKNFFEHDWYINLVVLCIPIWFVLFLFDPKLFSIRLLELIISTTVWLLMYSALSKMSKEREQSEFSFLLMVITLFIILVNCYHGIYLSILEIYPDLQNDKISGVVNLMGNGYYMGIGLVFLIWLFSYRHYHISTEMRMKNDELNIAMKNLEATEEILFGGYSGTKKTILEEILNLLCRSNNDDQAVMDIVNSKLVLRDTKYPIDDLPNHENNVLLPSEQIIFNNEGEKITLNTTIPYKFPSSGKWKEVSMKSRVLNILCLLHPEYHKMLYFNSNKGGKSYNEFYKERKQIIENSELNLNKGEIIKGTSEYAYNVFLAIENNSGKKIGVLTLQQNNPISSLLLKKLEAVANILGRVIPILKSINEDDLISGIAKLDHTKDLHFKDSHQAPKPFKYLVNYINQVNNLELEIDENTIPDDWKSLIQEGNNYSHKTSLGGFIKSMHYDDKRLNMAGIAFFSWLGVRHSRAMNREASIIEHQLEAIWLEIMNYGSNEGLNRYGAVSNDYEECYQTIYDINHAITPETCNWDYSKSKLTLTYSLNKDSEKFNQFRDAINDRQRFPKGNLSQAVEQLKSIGQILPIRIRLDERHSKLTLEFEKLLSLNVYLFDNNSDRAKVMAEYCTQHLRSSEEIDIIELTSLDKNTANDNRINQLKSKSRRHFIFVHGSDLENLEGLLNHNDINTKNIYFILYGGASYNSDKELKTTQYVSLRKTIGTNPSDDDLQQAGIDYKIFNRIMDSNNLDAILNYRGSDKNKSEYQGEN
ncbi:MAG: hypothetical protein JNM95_05295 [Chitinophagaceae bacterium]|nr:hypothetical protein [Chitinophagaceae bacterium]